MDRRRFLKDLALWSAGLAAAPCFSIIPEALAAERPDPVLARGRGPDYARLPRMVLEPLGGMGRFVKAGDTVVIKPNIGWDRTPEQGANTHPVLVRELARLAVEAGASKVRIFDRTCNEERRCYTRSGIAPAIEELDDRRVQIRHIDPKRFVPVDISRGKSITRWEIYRDALEADCYINVPVAKHHALARLTLGIKNVMGVLGGDRGMIHQDLGQRLADLATVVRPRLTVIDATRLLLRNGPQGGSLDDVKVTDTVLASPDPVAADAVAATLFDLAPDDIESTVAAHRLGLGEIDLTKIRVIEAS